MERRRFFKASAMVAGSGLLLPSALSAEARKTASAAWPPRIIKPQALDKGDTIGLITPSFLKTYRKYAFVAILVVAAIITPSPDWMSEMLVCIPLVLLYELSILISKRVMADLERRDKEWS